MFISREKHQKHTKFVLNKRQEKNYSFILPTTLFQAWLPMYNRKVLLMCDKKKILNSISFQTENEHFYSAYICY